MDFEIREITDQDISIVIALLTEGFPSRGHAYWEKSIAALRRRPPVESYPRYGYLLVADGAPRGLILLLTAQFAAGTRSNLSSWYVRPGYRKLASYVFQRSLRAKGGTYINVSPAPHVLRIIEAFGFKPYTGGTYVIGPRALFTSGGHVRALDSDMVARMDCGTAEMIRKHQAYGCAAIAVEDEKGLMPALYRVRKLRGLVPVACFLWGDPERLVSNRGSLARWLVARGIPAAFVDAPLGANTPGVTLLRNKGVRYAKGRGEVAAGDLRETELAIFGP